MEEEISDKTLDENCLKFMKVILPQILEAQYNQSRRYTKKNHI